MSDYKCNICGKVLPFYGNRCEDHSRCDVCGTKEGRLWSHNDGLLCDTHHQEMVEKTMAEFQKDENENWMKTHFADEITCPHCGTPLSDSWEFNSLSSGTHECDFCGNEFFFEVVVSVTYTTAKLKGNTND